MNIESRTSKLVMDNNYFNDIAFDNELGMEQFLIDNPSLLSLRDENFRILKNELPLKKGRKKTDGRIDLLGIEGSNILEIIELKKNNITLASFNQLSEYFNEKKTIITDEINDNEISCKKEDVKWRGILVGTGIDAEVLLKIQDGSLCIDNNIYVSAIVFKRYKTGKGEMFVTADTYINKKSLKDYTQYTFKQKNDQKFGKGRCVLEVVKDYCEKHSNITFDKLNDAFKKDWQGSLGVLDTIQEIESNSLATPDAERYKARYFMKHGETIKLSDSTIIAVCKDWHPKNFNKFIKGVKNFGYEITIAK